MRILVEPPDGDHEPAFGGHAQTHYAGSRPFDNNYFTEMCSGSEAGSYLRIIDFVYLSTLVARSSSPCESLSSLPTGTTYLLQGVRTTLEATQGQILNQSPTDATRFWWHVYGS